MSDAIDILPPDLIWPARTVSGRGAVETLTQECAGFGRRGILLHGHSLVDGDHLSSIMAGCPPNVAVLPLCSPGGEPTLAELDRLLGEARGHRPDWIAGVGGGSTMDLAKAIAGLLHTRGELAEYHDGAPLDAPAIPFVAVPTTAGSGSEATMVSVLINEAATVKKSIRDPALMARLVVLDPGLLSDCPATVIAHSGMDAFVQAVEAYSSCKATWLSDRLALQAIEMINGSIEAFYATPSSAAADAMLTASYLTGLAFSFCRLGAVHGLAHPLGIRYRQAHGLVCAVCLPPILAFNRPALGKKYEAMCAAVSDDLIERTVHLLACFGMRSPFAGADVVDREAIVSETLASGSTAANPRRVTEADANELLDAIFS
jgi:alcohol dehydrogenase class IV|tara:strand:- start:1613 stop:2734 length:1122 start_codon:yes stop_codon:yes gene_type:complete